ncbi:MAG TPA: cyclodeaminase/cyclohydrolase family protein [Polyangiales bacterium]|nr:cyclodeaminase/cyclohydrolase family protein [Polyangiales bacterium]
MTLWDQTLSEFRDGIASARPTPGGGSVCAVTASLGLGLVIMALEITHKRTPQPALQGARSLLAELSACADEDVRAFDAYLRAHRMPEGEQRERELRHAARLATEVPLTAARQVVTALELAAIVQASAHVHSDVIAGAELLHASLHGLFATLAMNLDALELELREQAIAARAQLSTRAAAALSRIRAR